MAFAAIQTADTASNQEAAATTTHDVTVPANIAAGNLLLLFIAMNNVETISGMPAGWTQEKRLVCGTDGVLEVWSKDATGSETNFTFTSSGFSLESCNYCLRISAHFAYAATTVEVSAGATGTDQALNPDSLTPSYGAADILWIASYGSGASRSASAYPTNYGISQLSQNSGGSAGCGLGLAARELNAASEDPAGFTPSPANNSSWGAVTVAVRPAGAGGGDAVPQAWAQYRRRHGS